MQDRSLNILMVAPQPFFAPRGTPFSVLHRIRALSEKGHQVDLITYPMGDDIELPGLNIIRCRGIPFVRKVKIGPSVAKLFLDVNLYFETVRALRRNRYDVIHSHEEAAFFCARLATAYGLLHVYDMHSSLPQQLSNFKSFNFWLFRSVFERLEDYVLRSCDGVITICDDLARIAEQKYRRQPHKMIENFGDDRKVFEPVKEDVAAMLKLDGNFKLLYTGTFEAYQGLEILFESIVHIKAAIPGTVLILVGGSDRQIEHYRKLSNSLGIADNVRFVGALHPSRIPNLFEIADVIVSPRSEGTNTPLKIYGYLRTGIPIVATNLLTHRQILNDDISVLVPPTPEGIADGVKRLAADEELADGIADRARRFAAEHFSDRKYVDMVAELYDEVVDFARKTRDAA